MVHHLSTCATQNMMEELVHSPNTPNVVEPSSDEGSDTSTVIYNHEPFALVRHRALALARSVTWADAVDSNDDIEAERMEGGSYNRIVGLTRTYRSGTESDSSAVSYILRIPRFATAQVDEDVAVLLFLDRHTTIPAPRVADFDESSDNALGQPYMVQTRLSGSSLHRTLEGLSHASRRRLAKELGLIAHEMLNVESSASGKLSLPATDKTIRAPVYVKPWRVGDHSDDSGDPTLPFSTSSVSSSATYFPLRDALARWKSHVMKNYSHESFRVRLIDRMSVMVGQLHETGYLDGVHCCLAHLDLAPRNIMISPTPDIASCVISGVLDWDGAILGPAFMTCDPPVWLWTTQEGKGADTESEDGEEGEEADDEDEDDDDCEIWGETIYDSKPTTDEDPELRDLFDNAAGPEYVRFAYDCGFSLARRLTRFIMKGINTNEDSREAVAMLDAWNDLMEERGEN